MNRRELENEQIENWFDLSDLLTYDDIIVLKKDVKKKFDNYQLYNKLKRHIHIKNYAYMVAIEIFFFHFQHKYPSKNIYFLKNNLFDNNSELNNLKYRIIIELPVSIEKSSGIDYGIVNYWIVRNSIIFKN